MAGKRKDVIAFLNVRRVIRKNLLDEHAGVAIVDADVDLHLFQRQHARVGLLLVAREQDAGVGKQQRPDRQRKNETENRVFHECNIRSGMRTSPLSVPM